MKRIVSFILAFVLAFGGLPLETRAFGTNGEPEEDTLQQALYLIPGFNNGADIPGPNAVYTAPAEMTVEEAKTRLESLIEKFEGKFFTVDGSYCVSSGVHATSCNNCLMSKVIETEWVTELVGMGKLDASLCPTQYSYKGTQGSADGYQCFGFANFAHWYIFAEKNTDKVTSTLEATGPLTYETIRKARPGDVLRSNYYGGHSMIFISCDEDGFNVIDSNHTGNADGKSACIVKVHKVKYNSKYNVAITGTTNYDRTAECEHNYENGVCTGCGQYKAHIEPENPVYFSYNFQKGKTYEINIQWDSAPEVKGSLANWKLQTVPDLNSKIIGDVVFKAAKKDTTGTAKIISRYQGTFTATESMPYLELTSEGLLSANNVIVDIKEVELEKGMVYEGMVTLDGDLPWLHTWVSLQLPSGNYYKYSVNFESVPEYNDENEKKTAWKLHATANDTAIAGTTIYSNVAANNTATQNFSKIFHSSETVNFLSFFTQRSVGYNVITIKVELAEFNKPYDKEDKAIVNKILDVSGSTAHCINDGICTEVHSMQSFDIYDDIIFVTYDGGYFITYDLHTGEKISEFQMGSAISHEHHCGNGMFGTVKYDPEDRFPLFYSSGDLSTKACYVERIITDDQGKPVGSKLIQWINFDMGTYAGANGAQAIVDTEKNRIIFQQRKNNDINDVNNAFVIGEYPLPAPTEGKLVKKAGLEYLEINLGTSDLIKPVYELPYWSPMYQGADYYMNQLIQTHGPTTNGFGSDTGLMTFKYDEVGKVSFDRYIYLTHLIGSFEPQGVAIWNGKLYVNYFAPHACIFEIKLDLGIDVSDQYKIACVKNSDDLSDQVAEIINKQLIDAGKDYRVSNISATNYTNEMFAADVTVKTPYTLQTISISGTIDHSFENGICSVCGGWEYPLGDLNLDGGVDIEDAYYARLVSAKLIKPTGQQLLLGDVDGDGKITAADANYIRRYALGIIDKLPV